MAKKQHQKKETEGREPETLNTPESAIRHEVGRVTVTTTIEAGERKPNGRKARKRQVEVETYDDVVVAEDARGLYTTRKCWTGNTLDPYKCYRRDRLGNAEAIMKDAAEAAEAAEKAREDAEKAREQLDGALDGTTPGKDDEEPETAG
jgi:hypothetical protein